MSIHAINTDRFDNQLLDQSKSVVKHTTVAAVALGTFYLLYHFDVCDWDKGIAYSCGTPIQSFKINFGLPLIALAAIYKVQKAFRDVWN